MTTSASSTESTAATSATTITTAATTSVTNIADEDLCSWAINDYQKKAGIVPANAEITARSEEACEITLTDENGEEVVLEYLDTVEYNGNIYMAFFPTLDEDVDPDEAEESEDYGLIIMRVETVNGEDELVTLEDEDEAEAVYNVFMEEAFSEDEDEE